MTSDVQFVNVTEQSGIGSYAWTPREKRPLTILGTIGNGAAFIDVDNDNNLDILLAGKKTTLFRGDGKGKFTEDPAALGNPQGYFLGCAVGDYDNDGLVDALVVDSEGKPVLLHNETKSAGHYVRLTLVGTKSPRSGHGALVRITLADGKTLLRHCQTDGSYLSASDVRVHVGIGSNTSVKSVEVTWPSGTKTTLTDVPVDKSSTITEGASTVR